MGKANRGVAHKICSHKNTNKRSTISAYYRNSSTTATTINDWLSLVSIRVFMLWPDKFVRDQDIFLNQRALHHNMNTAKRHSSIMTGWIGADNKDQAHFNAKFVYSKMSTLSMISW
jgi:hypothetical protein